MKVYVDWDEMYPCYTAYEKPIGICAEIEVDEETFKRWQHADDVFGEAQQEMEAAVAKARGLKIN